MKPEKSPLLATKGAWAIIQDNKDLRLYQGFILNILPNEENNQQKVELFNNQIGTLVECPPFDNIKKDEFTIYQNLFSKDTIYVICHKRTKEWFIQDWATFRSQPRETTTEHILYLSTKEKPQHFALDEEYRWVKIDLKNGIQNIFKNHQISSVVIDHKYKIKYEHLKLLESFFKKNQTNSITPNN